jgi:1-acyl-sn-glycerol-3-phosphate acyltransferase
MFFQNTWYQMGRSIVDLYVHIILRADIDHSTPLPKGAKIIAVNHPSTGDPAFVTVLTKEKTTILIKETLFKVPLFGLSLRMSGHVPVVAGNGRAALETGIRLLRAGKTVVIFPEGEISPEGRFHKAHSGVARLALATGAPVIPVGISLNHKRIRPVYTTIEGKQEMGLWYMRGPYAMTVGEPVIFEGNPEDHEQVHQVTGQIMQQIAVLHRLGELRLAHRSMKRLSPRPIQHLKPVARLSLSTPKSAAQVAWKGTWLAFQQSTRLVMRSAVFKAVESGLLFLLMYARNF